jgi:hypothetical protein
MPFKSKSQVAACFAKKDRGEAKGWNCEEWAHATPDIKKLPEHKKEKKGAAVDPRLAIVARLEKQASTTAQRLGIRAGALALGVAPCPA